MATETKLASLLGNARQRLREVRDWVTEHSSEIIYAIVFAIVFAWPAARFIDPPKHDPYIIHVVESAVTDYETKKVFEGLVRKWSTNPPMIGDAPVQLRLTTLREDTPGTAVLTAEEILRAPDTLMVIGHLPSGLTEASLPVYLGARPPVPYISTTASDDDLLAQCDAKCYGNDAFVPLIQSAPTNSDQGESAVRFAIQNGKRHFLIVTEEDPESDTYLSGMVAAYRRAVYNVYKGMGATVVGNTKIGAPPSERQIKEWNPDCVLYAGRAGAALTLLHSLTGKNLLVVFSDAVIETRVSDDKLMDFTAARFTYPADAADYNRHINVYGVDAVSIAEQIIGDLNRRGSDLRNRLKSLVHIETVLDARRNLVRVMEENSDSRTWYACETGTACVFDKHTRPNGMYYVTRFNGMFHVWQLRGGGGSEMSDIDGWHPPKVIAPQEAPGKAQK